MEDSRDNIIAKIQVLADEGKKVLATSDVYGFIDTARFDSWRAKILTVLHWSGMGFPEYEERIRKSGNNRRNYAEALIITLNDIIEQIKHGVIIPDNKKTTCNIAELENIFEKFHPIVRQLRTRYNGRDTLNVNDEYDVQDLLHALLLLYFKDVRAEEWTPSYAGGCVRADFLLKEIKTVIEVKKTRPSMTAKSLGEQLIIDIEKYKAHPDCKFLHCFVYDPEGLLGNPAGIKSDLESAHPDFLRVHIKPE